MSARLLTCEECRPAPPFSCYVVAVLKKQIPIKRFGGANYACSFKVRFHVCSSTSYRR